MDKRPSVLMVQQMGAPSDREILSGVQWTCPSVAMPDSESLGMQLHQRVIGIEFRNVEIEEERKSATLTGMRERSCSTSAVFRHYQDGVEPKVTRALQHVPPAGNRSNPTDVANSGRRHSRHSARSIQPHERVGRARKSPAIM